MKPMMIKLGLSASCIALAAGCTNLNYPLSTETGKYAARNFDEQVVDAAPAEGAPTLDAARADSAYQRYLDRDVEEVEQAGSFSEGNNSGGGGGSN